MDIICLKHIIKINIIFNKNTMTDIQCVFQSMSSKGSIYISNFAAAQDLHLLQAKGIKAILSVARSGLLHHGKDDIPHYLYLPAQDHQEYDIYKHFNQTYEFIEQARKQTNVLVHCMAGISRSVTIVTAYLLKKFRCSLAQVIKMLQRRRNKINPNRGFIEQLKKYAEQEGLKCNLQYKQALVLKQKGENKVKIYNNKSKEIIKKQQYNLSNPIKKMARDLMDEMSTLEKTNSTKQDIKQYQKKSEELQRVDWTNLQNQEDIKNEQFPFKPEVSVILAKRHSLEIKPLNFEKSVSIEQKISKIRGKILQKEQLRKTLKAEKTLTTEQIKQNKLQNLKYLLEQKKSSNKQLSEYFSLRNNSQSDPSPKKTIFLYNQYQTTAYDLQNLEKIEIKMCQTDHDIHSKSYKIDSRNLYSKTQKGTKN